MAKSSTVINRKNATIELSQAAATGKLWHFMKKQINYKFWLCSKHRALKEIRINKMGSLPKGQIGRWKQYVFGLIKA